MSVVPQVPDLVIDAEMKAVHRDIESVARALDAMAAKAGPPVRARQLDTWDIHESQLGYSAAVRLQLPVAEVSGECARRVLVRDVQRFARVQTDSGIEEWGAAIRLVVTVSAAELSSQLTVPVVAARVQLGQLHASARLQVLGVRSAKVGHLLPSFQRMDVETFGHYTKAVDDVRAFMANHEDRIVPVLLRRVEPPEPDQAALFEAVGVARALRHIARRRSLRDALQELKREPGLAVAVRDTYERFGLMGPEDEAPSRAAADSALTWTSWL